MCSCNSIIREHLPADLMKPMDAWTIISVLLEKTYIKRPSEAPCFGFQTAFWFFVYQISDKVSLTLAFTSAPKRRLSILLKSSCGV